MINGLVLSGGESTRMGEDKSMICYHGVPQYEYVYRLLEPYCENVYISSKNKSIYPFPTIYDHVDFIDLGPLSGLLSAIKTHPTDWIIIAIDYPQISKTEIEQLIHSNHSLASVFFNAKSGYYEPTLGFYRKEIGDILIKQKHNGLQNILRELNAEKIYPQNNAIIKSIDTPVEKESIIAAINFNRLD